MSKLTLKIVATILLGVLENYIWKKGGSPGFGECLFIIAILGLIWIPRS